MAELDTRMILGANDAFAKMPLYTDNVRAHQAVAAGDLALQQEREQMAARAAAIKQAEEKRALAGRVGGMAAQGDYGGAGTAALEAGDFDIYTHVKGLEKDKRDALGMKVGAAAPIAFEAGKLPYEQRKQFIAAGLPQLVNAGWSQEEIAAFDPTDQNIAALVASQQTIGDALKRHDEGRKQDEVERKNRADENKPVALAQGGMLVAPNGATLGGASGMGTPGTGSPGVSSSGGKSLGERNGNPGNIRDGAFARSQPGYLGPGEGGFARFEPGAGAAAQERLLSNAYIARGFNTVDRIIERYAPSSENSAASRTNYKQYVASQIGLRPTDPVPPALVPQLAQAMREFETGNTRGGARVIASNPKDERGTPPSGYQWTPSGGLAPIKGGPADKTTAALPKVPSTAIKAYTDNNTSLRKIEQALSELQKYPDGVGGRFTVMPDFVSQRTDPKGVRLRALIADIGSLKIHDLSGAAVTASETPRLKPFVPTVTDTPKTVREKLANFKDEYQAVQQDMIDAYSNENGDSLLSKIGRSRVAPAKPAAGKIPTLSPEQARKAPKGTTFRTTDGRTMVKQ